jgi:hypothetical protein
LTKDQHIYHDGAAGPLSEKFQLRAGDLSLVYQNGCLRYITANGQELVRNIYSAVRDRNWGTLQPYISNFQIIQGLREFEISFNARYFNAEIDFMAGYIITGTADNTIIFVMKGLAMRSFLMNRIGICVLHPLEGIKGKACKVTTTGNDQYESFFPEQISPHAPMTDIQTMEWQNETVACKLTFEGDIWEMEDQRNWSDSSYKTYCTPLSMPFPVEIAAGTKVEQQVVFHATLNESVLIADKTSCTVLVEKHSRRFLPELGIGMSSLRGRLSKQECEILKGIRFSSLRFDLRFSQPSWKLELTEALDNATALGIKLELVLHFTGKPSANLKELVGSVHERILPVRKIWFVDERSRITNNALIETVAPALRHIFPDTLLGTGTDAYFAEFNRSWFDSSSMDFISFAVCPQVHATDNDSMVENLEAQTDIIISAQNIHPGKRIQVSPVTLKQRFNVVATGDEVEPQAGQLPDAVDERQMSLFAAGWTLGSLACLMKSRAYAVTYYETTGWRGIIQGNHDPEKPELFFGRRGDIFPVYHLFRFLSTLKPDAFYSCISTHPLKITAIAAESSSDFMLILANHTPEMQHVAIKDFHPDSFKSFTSDTLKTSNRDPFFLDHLSWKSLVTPILELKPFALAIVRIQ